MQAIEVYTVLRKPAAASFCTKFFQPMSPNIPCHAILVGARHDAVNWRVAPGTFPGSRWQLEH